MATTDGKTRLRVMHVITGLGTGGAERALYSLLSGGLAARHACAVVSLADAGAYGARIKTLGVPVHPLNMRSGVPAPATLLRLRRIVRAFRPDVIQGWMYHGNLAAWMARQFAPERPALAWNIRQSLYGLGSEKRLTRLVIRANRQLSRAPAALLYNSAVSRAHHETFGFDATHGQVIPNGFDLAQWRPAVADERARVWEALGIPVSARLVGHVARLHPMKDHPRFLRVGVRLAVSQPNLHLLLAGDGVRADHPLFRGLIPATLASRFHFLGERDDVPSLMRSLDIFCQSSWSEAFPNVLGEAMASGVPCVATDVGDCANIVGATGIVVPPESDEDLYDGLERMLAMPAEIRAEQGRSARARVEADFSLRAIVDRYAGLYATLASRGVN